MILGVMSLWCDRVHAQVNVGNPWHGPWDWIGDLGLPAACAQADLDEFSHAALIPDGMFRGKVLLWRRDTDQNCALQPTISSWVFDPSSPAHLLVIPQSVTAEIFCGGSSWDNRAQLIVVGGLSANLPTMQETFRFRPRALTGTFVPPTGPTQVTYSASYPPWVQLGDMVIPRYYPTLITLNKDLITLTAAGAGTVPGTSSMVLGGPVQGPHSSQYGNPFWEFLGPNLTTWSIPFRPPNLQPIHASYVTGLTTEQYSLQPAASAPVPDLDSYPRALQLSTGHVFVANDIPTNAPTIPGAAYPTPAGNSWGIRLLTALFPTNTDSQLWRGPTEMVPNQIPLEREYGTAVLMHTRRSTPPLKVYDRVLVFGGKDDGAQAGPPYSGQVRNEVREMILGASTPDAVFNGIWRDKTPMLEKRFYLNAVVLPTGEILLEGGLRDRVGSPDAAVFQPELYNPGSLPTDPGSSVFLSASNSKLAINGQWSNPTPRYYHHVAVLLPDGRVLVAGGEDTSGLKCTPPAGGLPVTDGYPQGKYSGELFSPPYAQKLQLVGTHQPVFNGTPVGPFHVNQPNSNTNQFQIELTLAASGTHVDKVVLLRPASLTHHFDMDQRYIELEIVSDITTSPGQHTLQIAGPEYTLAPLGTYMLFAIEQDNTDPSIRIPSVAEFIRLDP
jgi:hypothetical protein